MDVFKVVPSLFGIYNVGQRGREDHPTSRVDESYPLEQ